MAKLSCPTVTPQKPARGISLQLPHLHTPFTEIRFLNKKITIWFRAFIILPKNLISGGFSPSVSNVGGLAKLLRFTSAVIRTRKTNPLRRTRDKSRKCVLDENLK